MSLETPAIYVPTNALRINYCHVHAHRVGLVCVRVCVCVCKRVEHVARLMRSGGEGISTYKVVAFQGFMLVR